MLLNVLYGSLAVTISFERGPGSGYTFNDMVLQVSSAGGCAVPYTVTTSFSATYTEPCSEEVWSGDLAYSSSFVVNNVDVNSCGVNGAHYVMQIRIQKLMFRVVVGRQLRLRVYFSPSLLSSCL